MGLKILKNFKKNIYWRINKYSLLKLKEPRYIIKSRVETMDKLLEGYSISRYGDGELSLIYKKKKTGINYQEHNDEINRRLAEILKSNLENHIVGIPGPLIKVDDLILGEAYFWSKYYYTNKKNLNKYLQKEKIYYDSMISRFYLPYTDKNDGEIIVKKLKQLFKDREVLIVEGENTRFGLGNELLLLAKTIKRILCPPKNAYKKYNKILDRVKKEDKKQLILLALGPTATILAYDLAKEGYQAVDIGHTDIEYEWYLRKSDRKIDIENKAVNEVSGVVDKEIKDKKLKAIYESQIIDKISLD
ncbi:GT-D fold domain-containing glycosyltransferase [Fusobacterium simiae]|uniref:GT-D fold domain-containing glycosyltransferase n=1 Tax=Fusobacterium TaxID=848 RepID=UPI0004067E22|nr:MULTISPECIES: GT-D fold domain-containing glycosyltransferase [Fusobacterium]MDC7955952.1 GT-D fold domain-containing glycosyltransferase [Fusobacterium simiae]